MRIEKKTWPESFQAILDGRKPFELRLADFPCAKGDVLVLREWNPETREYTGRSVEKKVASVSKTKELPYWSKEDTEKHGYQVISFDEPGNRPKVGVGVIVLKDNKVLLGKRKGSHGAGFWSFPGGHLEFNEKIEDCAAREVREETGLEIENARMGPFTNDFFEKEKKHYVTLFVVADYASGALENREPGKCEEWRWFAWGELPAPLFTPIQNLLKQGFNPFEK